MQNRKIRLLLIDDHPIVRFGLSALLDMQEDIETVGTAESGMAALEMLKTKPVDIILVDLRMPGMNGIDTLKRLCEVAPYARPIVLSSFEYDEEIYSAIKAGAQGFIHKQAPAEQILSAIRIVHGGKQSFPRRIAERLKSNRLTVGLSEREQEILQLVAKGLTNKEVANALQLSQFTVRNYLNHIAEKLDASDRTEVIFQAIQLGLITVS
ncbi:response regulator [Telmatobacter bradus]|uniref:response regulator n=1 Tax=Telmatobacter bradus TaxID=474953 RepID=UPI003B43C3DD